MMNNTSDSTNNDAISGNNTHTTTATKRRILALCGAKSNNTITKLQLQHLHIIDEHNQNDIYYLHGPIEVELNEDEDDDITNTNFVHGPFYSWFPKFDDVATVTTEENEENSSREKDKNEVLNESIVKAVHYVLQIIHTKGPFDGIYGFSQGAFIASLVAGISTDDMLQESIISLQKQQNNYTDGQSTDNNLGRPFGGGFIQQLFGRQNVQQNNIVTGDEEDEDNLGNIIGTSTQVVHRGSTSYHIDESFMIDNADDETGNSKSIVQKHYNPVSSSNKKSRRRNTSLTLELETDEDEGEARSVISLRQSSFGNLTTKSEFEGRRSSFSFSNRPLRRRSSFEFESKDTDPEANVVSTQQQQLSRSFERPDLTRSCSRPMRRWSSLELISSEILNNEDTNRQTSRVNRRRGSNTSNQSMRNIFGSLTNTSRGNIFASFTASITGSNFAGLLNDDAVNVAPFKFVILACAAVSKEGLDLDNLTCTSRYFGNDALFLHTASLIEVKSIQLIGVDDPLRCQSEQVASCFLGGHVLYMPGAGHQITTSSHDKHIITTLKSFIKADGHPTYCTTSMLSEFNATSKVSSLSLHQSKQIARVQLDDGLFQEHSTIINSLSAQPYDRPFLYNARNGDRDATTTYGQALDFITGGQGDLRRLGVKAGDVVAYIAPAGGSSVGALAFLSISAQTTAAPLAPNVTEQDCYDACEQFNARHMILFENVDSPGAERAFKRYSEEGKGMLHYAKFSPDETEPGQFEYTSKVVENYTSRAPLRNRHNDTALLLRTSGTTSRPKAVPLKQSSIVRNGAVISHSMQLAHSDVCYSVMPLFHIGGISGSILCTMASGGSVCCDNEPYDASRMIEALSQSNPQPTWYSSVPTIHNNTVAFMKDVKDPKYSRFGIDADGIWKEGHSLRMIRSGAASLHVSDAQALSKAYGDIPIYPTYSMSEQMPISQPPAGKLDTIQDKPGSVGVPVAADVVIVNPATLQPQLYGFEGEISIRASSLVMEEYLDNPEATTKSFFYLTTQDDGNEQRTLSDCRYFLTGDLGVLSRDDGFLTLNGRSKELIKKGGEQISPPEVEEVLTRHPWIKRAVVVSVDSKLYGEEVGVALVLSHMALSEESDLNGVKKEMRRWMKQQELAPFKWPTRWKLVRDAEYNALPRTNTRKLKRRESSTYLGFIDTSDDNDFKDSGEEEALNIANKVQKALIDWDVITGFRAVLACYVMFMHLGSNESWGRVGNLRGWPWHVHCFFTLGGFSLSSPMNPTIKKKFAYFKKRIKHIYPMYAMSLIFGLMNLLVVCRPSTFDPNFHWNGQPTDLYQPDGTLSPLFCEGTPAFKQSYWGSLVSTFLIYIFGLTVTPAWPMCWWMGYYLWFMSMYFQCLVCFPSMYNALMNRTRKQPCLLLRIMIALQILNFFIIFTAFVVMREGEGYSPSEIEDKQQSEQTFVTDGMPYNVAVLSFYLFGPFWILYFVIGGVLAFLYDSIKPAEKHTAKIWGLVADCCSLVMLGVSIAVVCQGEDNMFLRPEHANQYDTDSSSIIRLWDNVGGRIACPLTTIWIFSLSTGKGFTAYILRSSVLSKTIGTNSYGCFLFHQMVAQWYYAATRNGHFWSWWRYRKSFYWFSPQPCPIEWYEYFTVVAIVVLFSQLVEHTVMPVARRMLNSFVNHFAPTMNEGDEEINTRLTIFGIIENVTGIEPELDSTLDEVGLASVGIPVIVGMVNRAFNTKQQEPLAVTQQDLVGAKTIGEIIAVVDNARDRMHHDGV